MVASDDYQRALKLREELKQEIKKTYRCPHCGGANIEYVTHAKKVSNWISSVVTWLLGSYAIAVEKTWHCFDCKNDFLLPGKMETASNETD